MAAGSTIRGAAGKRGRARVAHGKADREGNSFRKAQFTIRMH